MEELFPKPKPAIYNCFFAITPEGNGVLLKSTPSLFDNDEFDGIFLEDNITNKKQIPCATGIYKCEIVLHAFRCNNPEDPEEWDVTVSMNNIEKIEVNGF